MNSNINILDCTLRDGGYYTNWIFDKSIVEKYLRTLKKNRVNYIEIGFKFFNKDSYIGQFGNVDENLIKWSQKIAKNNYGLMINASDFKSFNSRKIKEIIYKNFLPRKNSAMSFVRIASHVSESETVKNVSKNLKKLGYKVFINLMQITMIEFDEFKMFYNRINKDCDVFYIADSLGDLKDIELIKKICFFLKNEKKEFGIHAHDNQGLALKNTLLFKKFGANWLDSTVLGMGRGPGNVDTVKLVKSIRQNNNDLSFIKKDFQKLKKIYHWGKNDYYELASKKKIHPTYIQEILEYDNLGKSSINKFIDYLGTLPTHLYSKIVLEKAISKLNKDNHNLKMLNKSEYKNQDILVLGSSKNLIEKYFLEVESFIKKKKPLVFSLNFNKGLLDKYIDFYITGHINRVFLNNGVISNVKKIICPFKIVGKRKNLIIYPMIIKSGKFQQNKFNCVLPNMLSFTYSIAIGNLLKPKNIFLAGFDGYFSQKNLKKNIEMIETIKIIENSIKKRLISITPTIYPVKTRSATNYL